MNDLLKGILKSKTMWAAAAVGVVSAAAPYAPLICEAAGVAAPTVKLVGLSCAALMAVMRSVTKDSLADKVAPQVLPSPTGESTK